MSGTEGAGPDIPPVTTAADLEDGIFSITIALVQQLLGAGWTKSEACGVVAERLEAIASGLRKQGAEPT